MFGSGSKYWAESYINVSTGKIFLANTIYDLKEKINSQDEVLELTKAKMIVNEQIYVYKKDIKNFGKV